jgi:hypothetical protein
MYKHTGIWIDHRRAQIVTLTPQGEFVTEMLSHVEKHPGRGGDSPLKGTYEAAQVPADDRRQSALTGDLNRYYDAVIAATRDSSALLVLGPGEAKGELRARLQHSRHDDRISAVETAGPMSGGELVARVKAHFAAAARALSEPS